MFTRLKILKYKITRQIWPFIIFLAVQKFYVHVCTIIPSSQWEKVSIHLFECYFGILKGKKPSINHAIMYMSKLFSLVNINLEKCCFEFPLYIQAYIPLIFLPLGKPTKGSNVGSFFQSGRNSGPYHKSLTGAQLACPIFRALSFR